MKVEVFFLDKFYAEVDLVNQQSVTIEMNNGTGQNETKTTIESKLGTIIQYNNIEQGLTDSLKIFERFFADIYSKINSVPQILTFDNTFDNTFN